MVFVEDGEFIYISFLARVFCRLLIDWLYKEVALAQKRMEFEGRKPRGPYTKAKLKKIFSSWHIYLLTFLYVYAPTGKEHRMNAADLDPCRCFNNGAAGSQPVFQQ